MGRIFPMLRIPGPIFVIALVSLGQGHGSHSGKRGMASPGGA